VKRNLDREFALFMRKARAGLSYAQFAKKVGVAALIRRDSSLHLSLLTARKVVTA
jgi:hypothetical protein